MDSLSHKIQLAQHMGFMECEDYITMLAIIGDLKNLQKEPRLHNRTACAAALGGHLNILEWLYQKNAPMNKVMKAASKTDQIHILEWGILHGLNLNHKCMIGAVESGSIQTMQWLHEHGVNITCECYIRVNRDLEKAEWLYANNCICTHKECRALLDHFIENNNLSMINWLYEHGANMQNTVKLAAQTNNTEVLEWCIRKAFVISPAEINIVGKHCDFYIFKEMVTHGAPIEEIGHHVAYRFAYEGNLDALEWLKENKISTKKALTGALSGKNWTSILWSLENLSIDKTKVLPKAIRYTNIKLVTMLYNLGYPLSYDCYRKLRSYRSRDLFDKTQWLREHKCPTSVTY